MVIFSRVKSLKFARNVKFATSKTLVNFMKKMIFLSKNRYFSVQKALIYYTVNKSHHNSFILLVFSHVANFRYVTNFRFLTLVVNIFCPALNSEGATVAEWQHSRLPPLRPGFDPQHGLKWESW